MSGDCSQFPPTTPQGEPEDRDEAAEARGGAPTQGEEERGSQVYILQLQDGRLSYNFGIFVVKFFLPFFWGQASNSKQFLKRNNINRYFDVHIISNFKSYFVTNQATYNQIPVHALLPTGM